MWFTFYRVCDFFCSLIPFRSLRHKLRRQDLYDWRRKYNALCAAMPELNFRHTKMIKGGWNIGFIVDNKYVFKIRKSFNKDVQTERIIREKRITDAFADIVPLRIPKIEIVRAGKYVFFKYDFIPGKNLNTFSLRTIMQYQNQWGAKLAEFIYCMHNAQPTEIDDLRQESLGDGWNHNDICNNVIVDPKTMKIIGMIDWEYSGWGLLETEFRNSTRFSKKIKQSDLDNIIRRSYSKLVTKKPAK